MAEDLSLDSVSKQLQLYLKSRARDLAFPSKSLVFKLEHGDNLRVVDVDKKSYEVEEFFIESFRQTFSDKAYKYIRINNWTVDVEFEKRKCERIILIGENVTFIANKNVKKQVREIAFRIVAVNSEDVEKFSNEQKGLLKRIFKNNLLKQSENLALEFYSLISFVKRPTEVKIERMQQTQDESLDENPLEYLNAQGRKIVQKLRNHISRQDVFDFLVRQQLSSTTENRLRNLVLEVKPESSGKSTGGSKKIKTG